MSEIQKYNGWSNYETWLVSLWLHNEPERQAIIQEAVEARPDAPARAAWLMEEMRSYLQLQLEDMDDGESGLWVDLLVAAFNRVDWLVLVS